MRRDYPAGHQTRYLRSTERRQEHLTQFYWYDLLPSSLTVGATDAICKVQREAAIVTAIPGTTRDVLEISLDIEGLPVVIADTAGVRATTDVVEGLGIQRASEAYVPRFDPTFNLPLIHIAVRICVVS